MNVKRFESKMVVDFAGFTTNLFGNTTIKKKFKFNEFPKHSSQLNQLMSNTNVLMVYFGERRIVSKREFENIKDTT